MAAKVEEQFSNCKQRKTKITHAENAEHETRSARGEYSNACEIKQVLNDVYLVNLVDHLDQCGLRRPTRTFAIKRCAGAGIFKKDVLLFPPNPNTHEIINRDYDRRTLQ